MDTSGPAFISKRPSKTAKRYGEQCLDVYETISPTVNKCLSELTSEVQELLEWAEAEGVEPDVWGLNSHTFLANLFRLRNPRRGPLAVAAATKAAEPESAYKVGPRPEATAPASWPATTGRERSAGGARGGVSNCASERRACESGERARARRC